MANVLFRSGLKAEYTSLVTKDSKTFYWLEDSNQLYLGDVEITSSAALAGLVADVAENAADIATIHDILTTLQADDSVTGSIRNIIKSYVDTINVALNGKVEKNIAGTNGTAKIFNEADGGGAKFEHNDGTWSFVGVNDGGENGLAGQLYVVSKEDNKYVGTRLNMTKNGFYYVKGNSSAYTEGNEIATMSDLADVSGDASSKTIYLVNDSNGVTLYQGSNSLDMSQNTFVGTIQIQDRFLEDAMLVDVTYSDGHLYDDSQDITEIIKGIDTPATSLDAGKYLKMVLENVDTPIYINISSLIDVYTVNNQTDEIILSIANNNITGTVGEVAASKIVFEVAGGASTTVQHEIEDLKAGLVWQSIE